MSHARWMNCSSSGHHVQPTRRAPLLLFRVAASFPPSGVMIAVRTGLVWHCGTKRLKRLPSTWPARGCFGNFAEDEATDTDIYRLMIYVDSWSSETCPSRPS